MSKVDCKFRADCFCNLKAKILSRRDGDFPECARCDFRKPKTRKGKESKT